MPIRPVATPERIAERWGIIDRVTAFHFELRQFPHVARAFNLSREELTARVLEPWAAGRAIEVEERRWAPDRARLTIVEGPELAMSELGMGRGWANAVRTGVDVTAMLLGEMIAGGPGGPAAATSALGSELLGLCASDWVDLPEAVRLAAALYPQARPSEQLALAEQTVWELLHHGALGLALAGDGGAPREVGRERWEELIMAWGSWSGEQRRVTIRARTPDAAGAAPHA